MVFFAFFGLLRSALALCYYILMNQYLIQQKIKTIADLCIIKETENQPIVIDDVEFRQWDFNLRDGCKGDAWIAESIESAKNYREAFNSFSRKLSKIVPKLAFISQCYMDFTQESFVIYKKNNNPDKIAFIHRLSDRGSTGLVFSEEEKEDFDKIEKNSNNEFFWYINDCYNTTGYTAKLLLMFAALECLVGKEVKTDNEGREYEVYDKENMKKILGNEFFNKIYGQGGLRHNLTHGRYIDSSFSVENYVEIIHKLILEYFNNEYGTKLNTSVVNPQRHPFGNTYYVNTFIKPKNDAVFHIKSILENIKSADSFNNSNANFESISGKNLNDTY